MKPGAPLVLASASPRRRGLLSAFGMPFQVAPTHIDEDVRAGERPERAARRLARKKAEAASRSHPDAVVIAADTVVAYRGKLLGKPRDAAGAAAMLRLLRGRTHSVVTAVAVAPPGCRPMVEHAASRVVMRRYGEEEIEATIARGDPFDKAGAYAIQDPVFRPVERWDGCYCNVVGLPLWTALALLRRAGTDAGSADGRMPRECASCPGRPLS